MRVASTEAAGGMSLETLRHAPPPLTREGPLMTTQHLSQQPHNMDAALTAMYARDTRTKAANTTMYFLDEATQKAQVAHLRAAGFKVTPPKTIKEMWVPAGTPLLVKTTASKSRPSRKGIPKKPRGVLRARTQVGQLFTAYALNEKRRKGRGLTAAEAVIATGLGSPDGVSGSAWHRVGDLREDGLIDYKVDAKGDLVLRMNPSGRMAGVLVLTPLGQSLAAGFIKAYLKGDRTYSSTLSAAPKTVPSRPTAKATPTTKPRNTTKTATKTATKATAKPNLSVVRTPKK